MTTRSRIQHLVGLDAELDTLVNCVRDLCDRERGSAVLVSAPKGRGKSLLVQTAVERAKAEGFKPLAVSVDLEDSSPSGRDELLELIQRKGFLSESGKASAISFVKLIGDASVYAPGSWVSKILFKILGALPELADKLSKPMPAKTGGVDTWYGLMAKAVQTCAGKHPLILTLENAERISGISADNSIEEITQLIRQNLPILLIVTFDETVLSDDAATIFETRVQVGDAKHLQLQDASKEDMAGITGPVSDNVMDELFELAGGKVSAFEDLWEECVALKLVKKNELSEWVWDDERESAQFGKLNEGAFKACSQIEKACTPGPAEEKLVRLALGVAALQGQRFSNEVVANALWRAGIRLNHQYKGEESHTQKISELFRGIFGPAIRTARIEGGKEFSEFRSVLMRNYAISAIPTEHSNILRSFTAAALEEVFSDRLSECVWLIIRLYQECGQHERSRQLLNAHTNPEATQAGELRDLSARIRAIMSDLNWVNWVLEMSPRLDSVFAFRDQLSGLLDEASAVTITLGENEFFQRVAIAKAQFYCAYGQYQVAFELAEKSVAALDGSNDLDSFCDAVHVKCKALTHLEGGEIVENELRTSLRIVEARCGPTSTYTAVQLGLLGLYLCAKNRYDEAETAHRRAIAIAEKNKRRNGILCIQTILRFYWRTLIALRRLRD